MKVFINDLVVDQSLIHFNTGLNYGRFDYNGIVISNYKIIMPINSFIDVIKLDYNSIRDEIKMDDEEQNESSAFTLINYGAIRELLKNKQSLQDITTTYLDKILFAKLFAQSSNARFIINSTDLVEVKNDTIEISGRSYQKQ